MNKQKIIAIVNQKGGVGKTTTAVHISAGLAGRGYRVCLIDMDPQANASAYMGYEENDNSVTISNLILDYANKAKGETDPDVDKAINKNVELNIDYVASNVLLSSAELMLINSMAREKVLKKILKLPQFTDYDYIIIDCLPSLGILMINALAAATDVLIPVQCQKFAYKALDQLTNTIAIVREDLNDDLRILGVLATMKDNTNMSKSVMEALKARCGEMLFDTYISTRTEVVTSSYNCKPLTTVDKSVVGKQYNELADEIIIRYADRG